MAARVSGTVSPWNYTPSSRRNVTFFSARGGRGALPPPPSPHRECLHGASTVVSPCSSLCPNARPFLRPATPPSDSEALALGFPRFRVLSHLSQEVIRCTNCIARDISAKIFRSYRIRPIGSPHRPRACSQSGIDASPDSSSMIPRGLSSAVMSSTASLTGLACRGPGRALFGDLSEDWRRVCRMVVSRREKRILPEVSPCVPCACPS